MNKRYIINSTALVAGVFLIAASRVFTGTTLEWVAFGVSAAVAVLGATGLAIAQLRRHTAGFATLTAVAAWSAVAALVFTGTTLGWLVLADAIAAAAVAFGALVVHEVTTERVVHTLEVREQTAGENHQTENYQLAN
jgi:hypothetical protein